MQQITPDRVYHSVVDKSDWGPGPWQDEPDKMQWVDAATGLDCLINRGPLGNLCGYVGVPPTHPCHGADYDSVKIAPDDDGYTYPHVHGGLTYCGACAETDDESTGVCHVPLPGRPEDVWWLGFDCGHGGDVCPGMDARGLAAGMPPLRFSGETYRTVGYVQRECTSLAAQLVTATVEVPDWKRDDPDQRYKLTDDGIVKA